MHFHYLYSSVRIDKSTISELSHHPPVGGVHKKHSARHVSSHRRRVRPRTSRGEFESEGEVGPVNVPAGQRISQTIPETRVHMYVLNSAVRDKGEDGELYEWR